MAKPTSIVTAEDRAKIRRAEQVDHQLRTMYADYRGHEKAAEKINIKAGKLWNEVQREQLHRYIRKPGSRKGYISLEEYAKAVIGTAHTSYYIAKKMASLTEGEHALPEEAVAALGPRKANILADVPPERRTVTLVQEGANQTEKEFARSAQAAANEGAPVHEQKVMRVEFFRRLHPTVSDVLERTIEKYTQLKAVRMIEPDSPLTLQEKAISVMCSIAEGWADGEECAAKEKALDLGPAEDAAQEEHEADSAESDQAIDEAGFAATAESIEEDLRSFEESLPAEVSER